VGALLRKRSQGKETGKAFRYRDPGTMATIGRARAVAQRGKRTFTGWFAWLMWLFVHLMQIVQFQNRVLVLFQWSWYYLTFNRSARIITRSGEETESESKSPDLPSRDADPTIRPL